MKYICHICSKTISEKKAIEVELGGIAGHKIHFCSEKCKKKAKEKKDVADGFWYILLGLAVIWLIFLMFGGY